MLAQKFYNQVLVQLASAYPEEEARAIARWLFAERCALQRLDFLREPLREISSTEYTQVREDLACILAGEPLQYVLGSCDFFGLRLEVSPAVLIPRPETEQLVELILEKLPTGKDLRILEVGTGSGCIALALQKHLPQARVTAVDISAQALELARANAATYRLPVQFVQLDFLAEAHKLRGDFDVLVSNPPYISQAESAAMSTSVTAYEPGKALFVSDSQPLIFYEALATFAQQRLQRGGGAFFETHQERAEATRALFRQAGFAAQCQRDYFGNPRFVYW